MFNATPVSLIFCLLCYTINTYGQHTSRDSLQHLLQNTAADTARVWLLNEISTSLWYSSPDSAAQFAQQALQLSEQLHYQEGMALSYNNLGIVYGALGEQDKAVDYHQRALQIREATGYQRGIANSLNNIGRIYTEQANMAAALDCFHRALKINRTLSDKQGRAFSLQNIASVYYKQKNYPKALSFAQRSYQIAHEINAKSYIKESSRLLFQTYEALNQYKQAFAYQSVYRRYTDSLNSEANRREIAMLQSDYEIRKRDTEIALLSKDKKLHKAEAERLNAEADRKNLLLFAVVSCSVLLVLLAVILISYNQQHKQANALLCKKNEEIKTHHFNLKMKHEEIREQKMSLEELNGIKDRLFSIIAHDFRSPLNSLQGTLSLLQVEAISYEEIKRILPDIIRRVDYTVSLLDNLLNWARTQMSGMKTRPALFNLQAMTEETVYLLKLQAHEKGVLLHNLIPPAALVYADPEMIKLVVRNLLSNAIKFTNQGDVIAIKALVEENCCQIMISDTGCGIARHKIKSLFKPGNNSTLGTSNEKGTGLGLWICKDFVEKNGGSIWAESEKGKGSTFYFSVPKSAELVTHQNAVLA